MGSQATANEDQHFDAPLVNYGNIQGGVETVTLADNGWLLSWSTSILDNVGGYIHELHQQRFDAAGQVVGAETLVASSATGYSLPIHKVVALDNGGWINVWQEYTKGPQIGPKVDVFMQQYDADGNVVAAHVLVNDYTTGSQRLPDITELSDGGFVVSWSSYIYNNDGTATDIYTRRYDANGVAITGDIKVDPQTYDQNGHAHMYSISTVAGLPDGGWLVAYTGYAETIETSGSELFLQRYDAAGNVAGDPFQVNTWSTDFHECKDPKIAVLKDGSYVLTWTSSDGQDGYWSGIFQQHFDKDGAKIGAAAEMGTVVTPNGVEEQVNTTTEFDQTYSDVTALEDGGWVVAWQSGDYNNSQLNIEIFQQRYDKNGHRVGGETLVSSVSSHDQVKPSVTAFADGTWEVTWTDMDYISGTSIHHRRFAPDIFGDANDNILTGTRWSEAIHGGDGNDILNGGKGADRLIGGSGDDVYDIATDTTDTIVETADGGSDLVVSFASHTLAGNVEDLQLLGVADINGTGNASDNILIGNDGKNILSGLAGNDMLSGHAGSDRLYGGNGNDYLDGGLDSDTMAGGSGDDVYNIDADTTDTIIEAADGGFDWVRSQASHTLAANVERLLLDGFADINGTGNASDNTIEGNDAKNTLSGLDGKDKLIGGGGSDKLFGGNGADYLDGGLGTDTMAGGAGNDSYIVESSTDIVVEKIAEGTDTVRASVSYTLATNVEKLALLGSTNINGTGNSLANWLTGNAGNNALSGLAGNDRLDGGFGSDTLTGGAEADLFVFGTGYGVDRIKDFGNGADRLDITDLDGIKDFADLMSSKHLKVSGLDLIIFAGTDKITLEHVSKADLHATDFLI